jgi:hypothetical protein
VYCSVHYYYLSLTYTELHYESMCVVEDEDHDAFAIHQLPRRVLLNANVRYCEYLFEADSSEDVCETFKSLMDLDNVDVGAFLLVFGSLFIYLFDRITHG